MKPVQAIDSVPGGHSACHSGGSPADGLLSS
jgi:hypothetical protein